MPVGNEHRDALAVLNKPAPETAHQGHLLSLDKVNVEPDNYRRKRKRGDSWSVDDLPEDQEDYPQVLRMPNDRIDALGQKIIATEVDPHPAFDNQEQP